MQKKYYVYKYLNYLGNVIYVGQSVNWKIRLSQHKINEKEMMKEVDSVYVMECQDRIEMDILELYYIQKYEPKYNKRDTGHSIPSIIVVNKKWELVQGNIKEQHFHTNTEIKKDIFLNTSFDKNVDMINKIIEMKCNHKNLISIASMLMLDYNYEFNNAMNELESIFPIDY